MCGDCVRKYVGDAEVDTTTDAFKEVAALVEWVYAQERYSVTGGPLHLQLDDFNLEDHHCRPEAIDWWTEGYPSKVEGAPGFPPPVTEWPEGHKEKCLRLLELLRGMTLPERAAAVWVGHGRDLVAVLA